MTFVTKISLVTLDKSHETLVPNDKVYWMKEKIQQIRVHPLTPLYTYCVTCDYDAIILVTIEANDVLSCVLTLNYLEYYYCYYFEII